MRTKIIDMHCDSISELLRKERSGEEDSSLRENMQHLDLKRMKKSGYLLQNFALFVERYECADTWIEACALFEKYKREIEKNEDLIKPVLCYDDIEKNERNNVMSSLLTVEEGAVIKGSIKHLEELYDMGVRMMTLTWNYENEIGFPNTDLLKVKRGEIKEPGYVPETNRGLTAFGKEVVERMQEMGMIVDVSHLSDAGYYDVLSCTKKPFVASHSNARSVCGHVRNMTDDMISKLAQRGGVMGLNFYADFMERVPKGSHNPGSLDAAVRHARHIVNVGGLEVLGMGSDFDGISTNEAIRGVQDMERLWDALHQGGFTERELDHIFYKNVLRVYKDCLKS